jgi:hypothetical protein
MDTDSEVAKAKWLLIGGLVFLVCCFICYDELVYLLRGNKTQANISEAYLVTRHSGPFGLRTRQVLTVEYNFKEADGTYRSDSDTVSANWNLPADGTVPVRYTPGKDGRSRLAGHVNWFGIVFFVLSLGAMCYFIFRVWRIASEATKPSKPARKR